MTRQLLQLYTARFMSTYYKDWKEVIVHNKLILGQINSYFKQISFRKQEEHMTFKQNFISKIYELF